MITSFIIIFNLNDFRKKYKLDSMKKTKHSEYLK